MGVNHVKKIVRQLLSSGSIDRTEMCRFSKERVVVDTEIIVSISSSPLVPSACSAPVRQMRNASL